MTDPFATLADRLTVDRHRGDTFEALCPAHHDRHSSLSVTRGESGGVVLHCHAGCETRDVLAAVGMTMTDISPAPHIVNEYVYRDEDGTEKWRVERWQPKDFRVRPGLPAVADRLLYGSEFLRQARRDGNTVYVVEGEKDADRLGAMGYVAVCGVGGAGKWLPQYVDQLSGTDVIVIADADEPGRAHGREVARALDGRAHSVKLTEPSYGKDISDQLDAGFALDTLESLSLHESLGVTRADHVRRRSLSWLWPGFLPLGKLVMCDGDPGDGKSVMTVDLAARLSTGAPMPDGSRSSHAPCDVVMISAEDDPEDTIAPRLVAAGADTKRVHLVTEGTVKGSPFDLVRDTPVLEELIMETRARMLVIDPIMAFLGSNTDAYRDQDIRRALHPLTRMAARAGVTVLIVRHLTKSRTRAMYAGGGSIGFTGAARTVFMVGQHPEGDGRRVLSCVKSNVGRMPPALAYTVESSSADPDVPIVRWDDKPLAVSAQLLLDGEDGMEEQEGREDAREFLSNILRENATIGLLWQDVLNKAKKEGHNERTLRRIRRQVAVNIRNPINEAGNVRRGSFWFPIGAMTNPPSGRAEDAPNEDGTSNVVPFRRADPPAAEPAATEPARDAPGPGPCDVCGADPAVPWGEPYFVRRCHAHNPLTYGG